MYAAGVGLGMKGGKDPIKIAADYSGYVSLVKDSVRIPATFDILREADLTPFQARERYGS